MRIILVFLIIYIIFEIPISIGMGMIFKKMNLDYKKGLIPIYNRLILIKHFKLEQYHMALAFIPIISLYTNYVINEKLTKKFNKELLYIIKLTLMPFVFNIFFALDINEIQQENIDNYFEDQKNIYQQDEEEKPKMQDEYVWKPKTIQKANNVYKATRNNLSARINIEKNTNSDIIDNKTTTKNKHQKPTIIECPKCHAKLKEDVEVCFLCGTKLK